MPNGTVMCICIAPNAGDTLKEVSEVYAEAGMGLVGDRYHGGGGSWNKGEPGHRQVTLINSIFFEETGFEYIDARRNIVTKDVELMDLIGKNFAIGEAILRGIGYCDPCQRPSKLANKADSFRETFFDRGGLIAEIVESGTIRTDDVIVPPKKRY